MDDHDEEANPEVSREEYDVYSDAEDSEDEEPDLVDAQKEPMPKDEDCTSPKAERPE